MNWQMQVKFLSTGGMIVMIMIMSIAGCGKKASQSAPNWTS